MFSYSEFQGDHNAFNNFILTFKLFFCIPMNGRFELDSDCGRKFRFEVLVFPWSASLQLKFSLRRLGTPKFIAQILINFHVLTAAAYVLWTWNVQKDRQRGSFYKQWNDLCWSERHKLVVQTFPLDATSSSQSMERRLLHLKPFWMQEEVKLCERCWTER